MSSLAVTTRAPEVRYRSALITSYILAGLFVIMATAQLFKYESFPPLIGSYWLLGSGGTVKLIAALIVITEVFSLPFLLRMRVSPLMRWLSIVCGFVATGIWLVLSSWALTVPNAITNGGLLGATVAVPVGVLQLAISLLLLVLMISVSVASMHHRHHT